MFFLASPAAICQENQLARHFFISTTPQSASTAGLNSNHVVYRRPV